MSLKRDLKVLSEFSDNPYDAKYRPEKEMKKLFIGLMLTLPIFLGFCCQFYILISGPIFIYWIIIYVRAIDYWKDLGWKLRWYIIPTVIMGLLGLYLAFSQNLVHLIGWFIGDVIFYK